MVQPMENIYIKNWGIFVGAFDSDDLKIGKDREELEKAKKLFPQYKYTNTKIKKMNNIRKLLIYICDAKDFKI